MNRFVNSLLMALFLMTLFLMALLLSERVGATEPQGAGHAAPATAAEGYATVLAPMFQRHCVKCHGKREQVQGDVNLRTLDGVEDLLGQPELIGDLIEVLDSSYMPPEEEPPLLGPTREQMVVRLKDLLRLAVSRPGAPPATPLRRLNRFQYNNAVQDLLRLNVEVFSLPERMLREYGDYFQPHTRQMPAVIRVGSRPLGKSQLIEQRLGGVTPFPQDLRAENGFDNRADHLSLSPLLLESLLMLGRSIVQSPDFHAETCGIWHEFFAPPGESETVPPETAIRQRLRPFLTRAFRRPVDKESLDRYSRHVVAELQSGATFSDAMKAAAAAALASPRFFYLYEQPRLVDTSRPTQPGDYDLAARLSFFLWGSIPDQTLLDLAAGGKLRQPRELTAQVERMLADERLKRFCDSFPSQWLQLDRIISSVPDPERHPEFYFAKYRASMHMMLEPLLLFETLLVEDQSILKFIDSDFSYRSGLLDSWYADGTQGKAGPPVVIQFRRRPVSDRRQGGIITNAAVMTMTSSPTRTQPITRGAWIAGVILNDPPQPPPANVPPLPEKPGADQQHLTLREQLSAHRDQAACAGCHRRIDPLGFALENYDEVGAWRDEYENGRRVDASGVLLGRHEFADIIQFKQALLAEKDRFTRAFAAHLLAFALGRAVGVEDSLALDHIVRETAKADYRFHTLIKQIVLSEPFLRTSP